MSITLNLYTCLPYRYLLICCVFSIGVLNIGQSSNLDYHPQNLPLDVTGMVTDEKGEPLAGVNILDKGTGKGTITDFEGKFELKNIAADATLVISYLGYQKREISLQGQSHLSIVLIEDSELLDEVVVVGYATKRAGEVTGAISAIQTKDLEQKSVVDASEALRGVSGVSVLESNTPGEGATIRVRGLGTINDNNPLWIVDGVPGAITVPGNIESITILKDAASQAIYGARAANGVILVTSKKGKKNQKPEINFSVKSGFSKNSNYYNLLNTQEYGELLWLEAKNDGVKPNHPLYGNGAEPDIPEYIRPARATTVDESLYDNKMIHEDGDDTYLIMKANKEGTQWLQEADQNAQFKDISMDIQGGSSETRYAFQMGYLQEEGILIHTGYDRYNLHSHVSSKINPWLEIGQSSGVIYSEDFGHQVNNSEASAISWTYRMQPIVPVYDIAGNFAGTRAEGTGNSVNPIFILTANKNDKNKRTNIGGNSYLTVSPLPNLQIKSLFGLVYNTVNSRDVNFVEVAHAERGKFTSLAEESNNYRQWNWTNTIEYSLDFLSHHELTLLAGTEAIEYQYKFLSGSRSEFFSNQLNYIQLSTGLQSISNNGNSDEWSIFSLFGRLNYAYNKTYLLEAVVRRDGSSRFSKQNAHGIFPAVSAAWRITNESFMNTTSHWLSDAKLRLGFGITGNDRIGNYNSYTNFDISYNDSFYPINGSNNTTGATGFYQSTFGNADVKWESTQTINIGLDGELDFGLHFSMDFWKRKTSDMLYPKQIPLVLGNATPPSINVGAMENSGFDILVGYEGTALLGDLEYELNLNFSRYKNKIIKLSDNPNEFLNGSSFRELTYTRSEIGHAFPEFYGYQVEGIFQTQSEADAWPTAFGKNGTYNKPGHYKYKDINGDGIINTEDRTYIGSPHPKFTALLNFEVTYQGFELVGNLYTSYGNKMINYVRRFIDFVQFQGGRSHDRLYNSWGSPYLKDNSQAKLPIAEGNDIGSQQPSTAFIEDASYLRLENLRLGYNLNEKLTLPTTKLQIFGEITNVFTITKYSGLDPEVNIGGRNLGIDSGAWPTAKRYTLGLKATF